LSPPEANDENQTAAELYLSEETVRAHVRNVLKKLSIENRQDVSKWLYEYVGD